jgi:hypothetical protein
LKASFAQIKEACNRIDKLDDESLMDSDDEDGNQFLMIGKHIINDIKESTSGDEVDDPSPFMLNGAMINAEQTVNYSPIEDYSARGILPPMWKIWSEKDLHESVYKEPSTPKGLWHYCTHYRFHKNSKRDDINEIVNGPYEVTGLTLQEAHIEIEAACALHEKCIEIKLAELRNTERFQSPYKRAWT